MTIDFGSVQRYNTGRGFGFVSPTINNFKRSTLEIFFHIKTVKRKYRELAQKLDSGSYQGISFWYEVQKTDKGEQVSKLWLSPKDIPTQELDSLTARIEGLWRDIDASIPHGLNQVTLDVLGQIRRDELNQERERLQHQRRETEEQERKKKEAECLKYLEAIQEKERQAAEQRRKEEAERQAQIRVAQEAERIAIEQQRQARLQSRTFKIQKICEMYEIEILVHFTHIRNLSSILQHGLLGRAQLESMSWVEPPQYNDNKRLDGQPRAICLSISFPNYKMFYKYSCDNRSDWVVLLLKPSILWELDCKFYPENAASSNARETLTEIRSDARKQPDALRQMFGDYGHIQSQILGIPINFTTHPQAEVLVFDPIYPPYIEAVHFYSLAVRQQWLSQNSGSYSQEFYGCKYYFGFRDDFRMW